MAHPTFDEKILNFVSFKKVGGLRFLRIGRLQFSFCVVSEAAEAKRLRNARLASTQNVGTFYPAFTPAQLTHYAGQLRLSREQEVARDRAHFQRMRDAATA